MKNEVALSLSRKINPVVGRSHDVLIPTEQNLEFPYYILAQFELHCEALSPRQEKKFAKIQIERTKKRLGGSGIEWREKLFTLNGNYEVWLKITSTDNEIQLLALFNTMCGAVLVPPNYKFGSQPIEDMFRDPRS